MKKVLILSCILSLLSFSFPVKASHYLGGEITWECLSNGNYRFHMHYYRECNGIAYPNSITLLSNSPAGNITMNLYPNSNAGKTDISPVCNPDTTFPHITCGTVSAPNMGAVEEYYYTSDQSYPNGITLNGVPPPSGWVFSHASCCRNPSTNIVGQPAWYLQAVMYPYNNQNANPCFDSSPVFSEKPLSVICGGYPVNFNYNVVDPDLDSLFCEWAPPLQSANTPIVNYAPGYSYSSPVASITANPNNLPATIDTINGEISFLSYSTGAFITNVKVTSFKCGIKVSEVFREIQFVILPCEIHGPLVVIPPFQNPVTGLFTNYIDTVFAGDTVNFSMSATDFGFLPNSMPQTITLQASGSQFDTSFSSPTSGCLNPPCATLTPPPPVIGQFGVQTTFNWQTDCSHLNLNAGCATTTSIYNFIVKAEDDFCPAPGLVISTITVVILPKDTTEFVFVQDTLQPYNFNFFDNSSGSPTSWFWDFGDGTSSNIQNPSHVFANIGTYNVCLTPSDSLGDYCYKPVCHQVTIAMQAGFTYTQDTSLYNMYHFNDNSIGPVNSWEWDFDDSTTSNIQNPSHIFLNPGMYNVKLTVVDTNFPGISSVDSQQITIGSYNCLVADYSFTGNANDSSGNGYHAIVHGATLTTDRFGNPNSAYEFDGINDYIDTETSFDFQERTVSVWAQAYDTLIERVVIDQDAVTLNYGAFQVAFRNGNLVGNAGGDGPGNPFGNGPYDIVNNPHLNQWYHIVLVRNSLETKYYVNGNLVIIGTPSSIGSVTYQNPELVIGTYRGENGRFFSGKIDDLLIFDCELDSNQIDSLFNLQNYGPNIQAAFTYTQDSVLNNMYHFIDSSTGSVNSWLWDFDDSTSSNIQNPTHLFTNPGIYNIKLTVVDTNFPGISSVDSQQITIGSYNCLVADYSFTGNANDSSGNGYHAIVHGATLTTDRFGNPNSAYEFDGINDYIDTETSFDFQERTVSVWAQAYDTLIERVVIDQDAVTLNYGAFQVAFRNGNLVGNAGGDGPGNPFGNGPYDIVNNPHLNQWYHIVLVRNSLETKYYVNGNLVIIGTPSSIGSVTYQNPELVIGTYRGENGRFFSGKIDDLLIFDCELDSNQIDSLFNLQNYGPNCQAGFYFKQDIYQPLQLYFNDSSSTNINNWNWDFDDGSSSTAQNPSHYYSSAGTYNVCLTASDSNMTNCVDTICKQISVITGPVFNISGQVFAGTSPIDLGYAYLYSHNIGSIVPVDTFEIDTIGAYYFHQIATGFYIIKAELDSNSIYNNQYFPTYYGNVLTWATSSSVNLIQNLNNIDISMIAVPGPIPGPGNIGGDLSSSGYKSGKLGGPVPDIEVLLFDDQNAHLTLDYSNSSGSFYFANIAYGTYVVHPEIVGKSTIPATITIDANNPSATLHFVVDSNNITLGVDDLKLHNEINISEVYPNPFNNYVYIDISLNKPTKLKMTILDLVGKELSTREIETSAGIHKYKLDVDNLPQNIYYLQITLPNSKNVVRKLVKIR